MLDAEEPHRLHTCRPSSHAPSHTCSAVMRPAALGSVLGPGSGSESHSWTGRWVQHSTPVPLTRLLGTRGASEGCPTICISPPHRTSQKHQRTSILGAALSQGRGVAGAQLPCPSQRLWHIPWVHQRDGALFPLCPALRGRKRW